MFMLLQMLFQPWIRRCHDQRFPCPGHSNVQNPEFFSKGVHLQASGDGHRCHGGNPAPLLHIDIIGCNSQLRVQHHCRAAVDLVEFPRQPPQYHNGIFQTLAFVDGIDTDNVILFPESLSLFKIHLIFFQMLHISHKMKQSVITGFFIGNCLLHQHIKIHPANNPGRHGTDVIIVPCFLINILNQFINPHIACSVPVSLQFVRKFYQFFCQKRIRLLFHKIQQRRIQTRISRISGFFIERNNFRQFV